MVRVDRVAFTISSSESIQPHPPLTAAHNIINMFWHMSELANKQKQAPPLWLNFNEYKWYFNTMPGRTMLGSFITLSASFCWPSGPAQLHQIRFVSRQFPIVRSQFCEPKIPRRSKVICIVRKLLFLFAFSSVALFGTFMLLQLSPAHS